MSRFDFHSVALQLRTGTGQAWACAGAHMALSGARNSLFPHTPEKLTALYLVVFLGNNHMDLGLPPVARNGFKEQ